MAYSMDYRERAAAYKQEGHTFKQLREAFGIPSETYYQRREKLAGGYYQTPVKRERVRKIDKAVLRQAAADRPDAFLKEYAGQFGCTAAAVFCALEKLDITRKKNRLPIPKKAKRAGRNIRRG